MSSLKHGSDSVYLSEPKNGQWRGLVYQYLYLADTIQAYKDSSYYLEVSKEGRLDFFKDLASAYSLSTKERNKALATYDLKYSVYDCHG